MSRKQRKKAKAKPESEPLFRKIKDLIAERMPVIDRKRLVMLNIPYVIVFYLVDKLAWLYRHCCCYPFFPTYNSPDCLSQN